MKTVAKWLLFSAAGLCVPIAVGLVDPKMIEPWHAAILGAFSITFLLADAFFKDVRTALSDLHKSPALTIRESEKLASRAGKIQRRITYVWAAGMFLRLACAVCAVFLIKDFTWPAYRVYWGWAGYIFLGASVPLLIYFLISFFNMQRFKKDFILKEKNSTEIKRRLDLLDSHEINNTDHSAFAHHA